MLNVIGRAIRTKLVRKKWVPAPLLSFMKRVIIVQNIPIKSMKRTSKVEWTLTASWVWWEPAEEFYLKHHL
jgi:hypothetical protein